MRKLASSCKQLVSVFTCFGSKYIIFCFQNLGNGRKDKNGHTSITFGFDDKKKKISADFAKIDFFSFFKQKVVYLPSLLSFPNFENKISSITNTNM